MGIDIRDGQQLDCITCALCIDACDDIMDKIGKPRGLIAYDTVRNLDAAGTHTVPINLLRPRVILYATAMVIVGWSCYCPAAQAGSRHQRPSRSQPDLCQAVGWRVA